MIRPENQPIDNVPRDLDPRVPPDQKLRRRHSWQREAAMAVAAVVIGALGKRSNDRDDKGDKGGKDESEASAAEPKADESTNKRSDDEKSGGQG